MQATSLPASRMSAHGSRCRIDANDGKVDRTGGHTRAAAVSDSHATATIARLAICGKDVSEGKQTACMAEDRPDQRSGSACVAGCSGTRRMTKSS